LLVLCSCAKVSDDVFFAEVFGFNDDFGHRGVRGEKLRVRRKVFGNGVF